MFSEIVSRIEGEGRVEVVIDNNSIRVDFYFTEPQRFFEKVLRGVSIHRGIDIVSRICGFCGTSHMYTYVKSFETNYEIPPELESYREILLGIERLKSHLIHSCFLYIPDIVGVKSINELYSKHSYLANKCFELLNNLYLLNKCFEHRLHNIVNIRIGGVYEYPDRDRVNKSRELINKIKNSVMELIKILSSYSSLFNEKHFFKTLVVYSSSYPVYSNKVMYSDELIDRDSYLNKLVRIEKRESRGVRYCFNDRELFITGPLARINIYRDFTRDIVREYLSIHGFSSSVFQNIYASVLARIVEVVRVLEEIEYFVENYRKPLVNYVDLEIDSGVYSVFVEAPRGVLYHRYIVENNKIVDAIIITPTQLNAYIMENIPIYLNSRGYELSIDRVKMIIRSLDPCLSCAVHVNKVE